MITALIGLATGMGIAPKFAKPVVFTALAVLIGLALWGGKCAYDSHVISAHETRQELKQARRERKADQNLQANTDRDDAAAQQRREEMENATRGIPDQRPSARQHAIACSELRREAKQRGKPEPAC
jgi:hypothetical protein